MRVGFGYDIHLLVKERPLILGGVNIPYLKGLKGHSDADVLCHAVSDALLGAAALGDIGVHFPDTDDAYKDASSIELLKKVRSIVASANFRIVNIDSTIVAQNPKIGPYRDQMRENIAEAAGISPIYVSVKATTNEGIDAIGKGEAIAVYAVAMIE
ncbi:2-C-methyl-D-erythritol 2,4-cyclodiphosphate synthase [bacterium]|nr:2-C-methyl-D-erythritol 2,4-cyclodiphosphate synthase [bacterium]